MQPEDSAGVKVAGIYFFLPLADGCARADNFCGNVQRRSNVRTTRRYKSRSARFETLTLSYGVARQDDSGEARSPGSGLCRPSMGVAFGWVGANELFEEAGRTANGQGSVWTGRRLAGWAAIAATVFSTLAPLAEAQQQIEPGSATSGLPSEPAPNATLPLYMFPGRAIFGIRRRTSRSDCALSPHHAEPAAVWTCRRACRRCFATESST